MWKLMAALRRKDEAIQEARRDAFEQVSQLRTELGQERRQRDGDRRQAPDRRHG